MWEVLILIAALFAIIGLGWFIVLIAIDGESPGIVSAAVVEVFIIAFIIASLLLPTVIMTAIMQYAMERRKWDTQPLFREGVCTRLRVCHDSHLVVCVVYSQSLPQQPVDKPRLAVGTCEVIVDSD